MTLETLLLLAGLFHFALLPASLSVPKALGWREELAKLSPLSRQVVWVHGAYIAGLIVAFGAMTLFAAGRMARGEEPMLAGLIAFFWLGRLAIQLACFHPKHWPRTWWAVAGRYGLTALFTYWSVVYLLTFWVSVAA